MVRYICAIFIVALPILVFLYNGWIMSLAYDYTNLKKLAKEITSSTFFLVNCFVLAITFLACMTLAIEIWDSQKNCNVPKTYYIEAELIAKDATTVFKVTDNGNKVTYYETDISLNIADNGKKLIKEIQSPTYFISSIFTVAISLITCFAIASEMFIDTPYTYYAEAELVAKDTTTVFKVTDNGNKISYYETDIDLNIADNENKNNYMLLMNDNTTREDKSDDIILAVYNTVGKIENK